MPRGFTPQQTVLIRQKLIDAALEKVQETGVRKTSVETLARAAHISTGAFYKFFSSKEDLFFQAYELLENRLRAEMIALLEPIHEPDLAAVKRAVLSLLASESMQRLMVMMQKEDLDYLLMNIEPEKIQQHLQSDQAYMDEVLSHLKACGMEVKLDAGVLISYAQALFLLSYQRQQLEPHAERIFDTFLNGLLFDLTGWQTNGV